ncbi:MAG: DUF3284 domain-containing protein [Turicibacter sp.]|nr:DUF3284 domain-containing protein [Turicibacter sp.]
MNVNVKLQATPDEFYSLLMNSIKYEIDQATGKDTNKSQIKTGFNYTKMLKNKLGRPAKATATLTKIEKPYIYEAEFLTGRGVNRVRYAIKELEEGFINVNYVEEYDPISKPHELNHTVMSWIFTKPSERKAKALIEMMGEYIKENKTGEK